ncbi:protein of unknown function DUF1028 [Kribbella flavida DSM 17836]|uniref:Putative peptidoglycan binding domain-containing protein n=1 Tax=Kribbella flavida (strain DSM 17836 / JCM 10339 / NBRC 14399) TaxID=479435 RepID=D2PWA3_KRIFD|nr:DUF1028 domain-containing protein [Kribbella flavida]ADB31555.1 protein of unknown function DUF1028 [Kribbella flavida DSM 17836]
MTFSIVAYDPESASWGVAVASKFLAVGAVVPWGRAGAGAVATQAAANLSYGPDGLDLLAGGLAADEVVARLTGADDERDSRQVGVVDTAGRGATFTGPDCLDWAGGQAGDGYAVQGNILAGPQVVEAMAQTWRERADEPFERRLLESLVAGDRAGGDRRGRQSAALRVWRAGAAYGGVLDLAIDLRVDDHRTPTEELGRLLALHELYFGKPDPAGLLPLEGALAEEVAALLDRLGYSTTGSTLADALDTWAGTENFEERLVPGRLDPVVLEQLRNHAPPS